MTDVKLGNSRYITPKDVYDKHKFACYRVAYLVKKYIDKPKVLVLHHAPSFQSSDPSLYPPSDYDWAYYSNFERIFAKKNNVKLCVHGHTHHNRIYRANGTVVCSNQRGYAGRERSAVEFDPSLCDITVREVIESVAGKWPDENDSSGD
jgi:calcineurin-like phosphoesterase family protein